MLLINKANCLVRNGVAAVTVGAVAALIGCGDSGGFQRVDSDAPAGQDRQVEEATSAADRFGFQSAPQGQQSQTAQAPFTWETPDGWEEAESTSLRLANFRVGPEGEAECYMTVLPNTGGGIAANVNRWRTQMGLEAYTPEEIEQLPQVEVLGGTAVLVEFEGTYQGMSGNENEEGYRLLGVILEQDNRSIFVKMVGPKEVVAAERDRLEQFCSSIEATGGSATAGGGMGAGMGQGEMPRDATHGFGQGQGGGTSTQIAWEAPEGWSQGPDRPMREVTMVTGPENNAECYVTILAGDGGGVEANINRWAQQMDAATLQADELEALPTISMFGQESKMVELEGDFTDMQGPTQSDYMMYGAVCLLGNQSVFVKMTGPREVLQDQRDNFIEFCESLQFTEDTA